MALPYIVKDVQSLESKLLVDGLFFGEAPRWNDGNLYVSDMTGRAIYKIAVSADGAASKSAMLQVPNQPNGMCFLPDGSLIYSSMFGAKLYRWDGTKSTLYADLAGVMTGYCGDMVIDVGGRVFIDDTGARVLHGEKPSQGRLLVVTPPTSDAGIQVSVAADGLVFPNGLSIDSSGTTLYVAETFASKLNAFRLDPRSGALDARRQVWNSKELAGICGAQDAGRFGAIDGICMDAEDGIWLSMLGYETFIRKNAEGNITHQIPVDGHATACALGGEDGKTLFLVVNWVPEGEDLFDVMVAKRTKCSILCVKVEVGKGVSLP